MGAPANPPNKFFAILNVLLGLAFIGEFFTSSVARNFSASLDAIILLLAASASIVALNRQLPLQNVLTAAFITALLGTVAHGLSANPNVAIPFGPLVFQPASGGKIFNFVPWSIPLLWIVVVFNARSSARLILRPWRKIKNYGFWLIGLTTLLVLAFDLALEPFATHVRHFWIWQPTKIQINWFGASPLTFIGWAFVTLLILAFATPSLIKKLPGKSSTPDFQPFAIWLGALILFAVSAGETRLWWAVGVDAAMAAVTLIFAVRGAKW